MFLFILIKFIKNLIKYLILYIIFFLLIFKEESDF